jgi:hypothetical protein
MAAKKKVEMKANKKLIFLLNSSHSCGISSWSFALIIQNSPLNNLKTKSAKSNNTVQNCGSFIGKLQNLLRLSPMNPQVKEEGEFT